MTIEQAKVYKERAMKIKALLDEFFVDLQGSTYSNFSTPLYHMARENLKVINHLNDLISKWEPTNLSIEEVHLKMAYDSIWNAYASNRKAKSNIKEYNIKVSQKIQKLIEKADESLNEVETYLSEKLDD